MINPKPIIWLNQKKEVSEKMKEISEWLVKDARERVA